MLRKATVQRLIRQKYGPEAQVIHFGRGHFQTWIAVNEKNEELSKAYAAEDLLDKLKIEWRKPPKPGQFKL